MKFDVKPLKQTTEMGCLATCYLMIRELFFGNSEHSQDVESNLTSQAFRSETNFNEHFYLKKLFESGCEIKVLVETPYMAESYDLLNKKLGCKIDIQHALIGIEDYVKLLQENYLIITLTDLWYFDMVLHFPHYVIVHSYNEESLFISDPKYGNKIKFSNFQFEQNLKSLKERMGYSPLIFAIKKK